MNLYRNTKGFTLIESVFVILILALLMSILLFFILGNSTHVEAVADRAAGTELSNASLMYISEYGNMPVTDEVVTVTESKIESLLKGYLKNKGLDEHLFSALNDGGAFKRLDKGAISSFLKVESKDIGEYIVIDTIDSIPGYQNELMGTVFSDKIHVDKHGVASSGMVIELNATFPSTPDTPLPSPTVPTDPRMEHLWIQFYGEDKNEEFLSIAQNSDYYFIATREDGEEYAVFKYDSNRTLVKRIPFEGVLRAISQTNDGGIIAAGIGDAGAMLVKYDANGNQVKNQIFGGSRHDDFSAIAQTLDGGYIAVGQSNSKDGHLSGVYVDQDNAFIAKFDQNLNVSWVKGLPTPVRLSGFDSVQPTLDGGYIVAGSVPDEENAAILVKYQANGAIQWQKAYGHNGSFDRLYSVKQTSDNGYVAVGEFAPNGVILRVDSNGNTIWEKQITGEGTYALSSVEPTSDGGYIASGYATHYVYSDPSIKGKNDGLIIKFDQDGNECWRKYFGGQEHDRFHAVIQTKNNHYITVGYMRGTYGNLKPNSGLYSSAVLVEFDENGNYKRPTFAGTNHSLLLMDDGTVMAWGDNSKGQLGTGDFEPRTSPVLVEGLRNVVDLHVMGNVNVARMKDGSILTWGTNENPGPMPPFTVNKPTPLDQLLVP